MAGGASESHRRRMPPRATWATPPEDDRTGGRRLKALKRLPPGAPGTKRLTAVYGERLVFVHYRKDLDTGERLTTVELIVEVRPPMPAKVIPPGHPVGLAVQLSELEVRAAIKAAGGRWNPEKRLWFLPHGKTLELHLTDRIADWGALE